MGVLAEDRLTALALAMEQCAALLQEASLLLSLAPEQAPGAVTRPGVALEAGWGETSPSVIHLGDLFASWSRDHQALGGAPTTRREWKRVLELFSVRIGNCPAHAVTAEMIRSFRDDLLLQGLSARTVRGTYLSAIKAMFSHGIERGLLESTPFSGLRLKRGRFDLPQRMGAFSDADARTILAAASRQSVPLRRFAPWLMALTGSRVSAIVNLRGADVFKREGLWVVRISREAGPVKTAESEREVPICNSLISLGFLDFVATRGQGRLFYDDKPPALVRDELARYNPGRVQIKYLSLWTKSLGVRVGREQGIAPNHAWRHWFREKATALGVLEKVTDAIVGHAPNSASRAYGSVSLATMKDAIDRIECLAVSE